MVYDTLFLKCALGLGFNSHMQMQIKYRKPKEELKEERFTTPVTATMKADIERICDEGVLVHDMVREYLQMLIDKADTEQKCS